MDKFIPDMYQKSIYHIDYDKLQDNGIKCLLIDLDNTCVPYKDKEPNKKLIDLFETLKDMDFKIIIFSQNFISNSMYQMHFSKSNSTV